MRLASDPVICDYKLYLPKDWKFDVQTNLTSGYCDEDKTSISMYGTIYEEKSYDEYWKNTKTELQSLYGADCSIEEVTLSEIFGDKVKKIGGEDEPYAYRIAGKTPSGQAITVIRITVVKGYYLFTLQYTALDEYYDAHLKELTAVANAFRFKGQK